MPKRRRLATGVYADANGISVIYHAHGKPIETRFDPGTPLDRMVRWRKRQIGNAAEMPHREPRGTLARDAVRFLKTRKGLANYVTEKANLKAWVAVLRNPPRWKITTQHLEQTVATWRAHGYSEQTLRHRCRILRQLLQKCDGKRALSPFDDFTLPKKPRPRPISVSDEIIRAVAIELRKHEILKWLKTAKTRARYLVLASTGHRPAEVKRTQPADLDLDRRLWFVRTAKGGVATILHLNDDMLAAWSLFVQARAWGRFDTRNFGRALRRCGWPAGIRPYALRHSTGLALSEAGADLGDIQAHLGHASIETTRQFYVPAIDSRRARTSRLLEGRLGPAAFSGHRGNASTITPEPDAKARDSAGISGTTVARRRLR